MSSLKEAYEADPKAHWGRPQNVEDQIKAMKNEPRGEALFVAQVVPEMQAAKGHGLCLDLGCGGGRYIRHAAENFRQVMGVDFSAQNLEAARMMTMDLVNIEFIEADLGDMKAIYDEIADFAYSMAVFMHIPNENKRRALRELGRVLKSGASVALVEILPIKDGAFDCPDITSEEWLHMINDAGLAVEEISSADPFTKYTLKKEEEGEKILR